MSTVPSPVSPATPGLLQNPITYVVLLACYIGYDKFSAPSDTARDPEAVQVAKEYVADLPSTLQTIGDQIKKKNLTTPAAVLAALKEHSGPFGNSLNEAVKAATTKDAKGVETITDTKKASQVFYDAAAGAKKPMGIGGYFK